jgi:ribosome biogenesis GTPase A
LQQAAEILIHEFRGGSIGRITLETADEYAAWLAQGKVMEAERLLRKEQAVAAGHIRPARRPAGSARSR